MPHETGAEGTDEAAAPAPEPDDLAQAADELRAAAVEVEAAAIRAATAEQALSGIEGLVDVLLGRLDDALVVLDTDLRVIGWSAGAEQAWDRLASEAVGRRWSRLSRSIDASATGRGLDELVMKQAPGATASFGEALRVELIGDDDVVRYLLVSRVAE